MAKAKEASVPALSIEDALALLEAREGKKALLALLDVWRARRVPQIAEAIDSVGRMLAETQPPIVAVGNVSAKKAWYAAAAVEEEDGRAEMMNHLLASLPDGIDRLLRLEAIEKMAPDPRFTTYAVQWMNTPPIHGPRRRQFYGKVIEILDAHGDVRLLESTRTTTTAQARTGTIAHIGLANWKPLVALTEKLDALVPPSLSPEELAALTQILRLAGGSQKAAITVGSGASTGDSATFFTRVYENPADDEARAVLGDLLQQQGDPRGEFIAMQLARYGTDKARSSAEKKLEETWGRKWLGALEPAVLKGGVVFERGFVSALRYEGGKAGTDCATAEEWSTVVTVDVSTASKFVTGSHQMLLSAPARRSMRHVTGLSDADFTQLVKSNIALPWETLGLRISYWQNYAKHLLEGPRKTFDVVTKLVLEHAWYSALTDVDARGISDAIAKWSKVDTLELAVEAARLPALAKTTGLARIKKFIVRNEPHFDLVLATGDELCIVLEQVSDGYGEQIAPMCAGLKGVIKKLRITASSSAKVDGKTIVRGRRETMKVSTLEKAAANAGAELVLDL